MVFRRWLVPLLLSLTLLVLAGSSFGACKTKPLSGAAFNKATQMGLQLLQTLELHQPEIALVGRVGSDLSGYGLTYSHMGIVRRDHPAGKWVFTHLLNHCKQSSSSLYEEGLITFFTDSPFRYQAILVIPKPALQKELSRLIKSGAASDLHEEKYSVLANPFSTKYQNSNQWILELLSVAKSIFLPADQRQNALQLAKDFGYQPERVKIGFFKQLGAAIFSPNVRFDDHSDGAVQNGIYPFVSVRSVIRFLKQNSDISLISELKLKRANRLIYRASQTENPLMIQNKSIRQHKPATQQSTQNAAIQKAQSANHFWQAN